MACDVDKCKRRDTTREVISSLTLELSLHNRTVMTGSVENVIIIMRG